MKVTSNWQLKAEFNAKYLINKNVYDMFEFFETCSNSDNGTATGH